MITFALKREPAAVFERAYGCSIVVIGYQDKGITLKDPVFMPEEIVSLEGLQPTYDGWRPQIDKDKNSPRFGLPVNFPNSYGDLEYRFLKWVRYCVK